MRTYNGMPANHLNVTWKKTPCSSPQGDCVELARLAGGEVAVRNSRDPEGPALIYTGAEITHFIHGIKDGAFDHLLEPAHAHAT